MVHLRQEVVGQGAGVHGDPHQAVAEEGVKEDRRHRDGHAQERHHQGVRDAAGQLLRLGGAALGQLHEALDHAEDRAHQADHRAERADGAQVVDELFLARADRVHHVVGRLAGVLDAVLQPGHAGAQHPGQERAVAAAQVEGLLELPFVDGVGEVVHEGRWHRGAQAQVDDQQHDQGHEADGHQEQERPEEQARRADDVREHAAGGAFFAAVLGEGRRGEYQQ